MTTLARYRTPLLVVLGSLLFSFVLLSRWEPAAAHLRGAQPADDMGLRSNSAKLNSHTSYTFPRTIWQSWKNASDARTIGHEWATLNPEHKYVRITDSKTDSKMLDILRSRCDNGSPYCDRMTATIFNSVDSAILRADFLRYLLMLTDGGIWADVDVVPRQPILDWAPWELYPTANLVVGIESDRHKAPIWRGQPYSVQFAQYAMMAKPGHPAIAKLVEKTGSLHEKVLRAKKSTMLLEHDDAEEVMRMGEITGPFVFTDVLMHYFANVTGQRYTGNELDGLREPRLVGDVLIMPVEAFGWLGGRKSVKDSILVQRALMSLS